MIHHSRSVGGHFLHWTTAMYWLRHRSGWCSNNSKFVTDNRPRLYQAFFLPSTSVAYGGLKVMAAGSAAKHLLTRETPQRKSNNAARCWIFSVEFPESVKKKKKKSLCIRHTGSPISPATFLHHMCFSVLLIGSSQSGSIPCWHPQDLC